MTWYSNHGTKLFDNFSSPNHGQTKKHERIARVIVVALCECGPIESGQTFLGTTQFSYNIERSEAMRQLHQSILPWSQHTRGKVQQPTSQPRSGTGIRI